MYQSHQHLKLEKWNDTVFSADRRPESKAERDGLQGIGVRGLQ